MFKASLIIISAIAILGLSSCSRKAVRTQNQNKDNVYQPTFKDRLFDRSISRASQYAEIIKHKMPDGSLRTLKRYNKTPEVTYSLYVLIDTTIKGEMGWHSFILSEKPIFSPEVLALCPLSLGEVYLYENGEFVSSNEVETPTIKHKLTPYYKNKKYDIDNSCLWIAPTYPKGTVPPPPKCVEWYWVNKNDKGKVLSKRLLFTSCDIVSWSTNPNYSVKPKLYN